MITPGFVPLDTRHSISQPPGEIQKYSNRQKRSLRLDEYTRNGYRTIAGNDTLISVSIRVDIGHKEQLG
jgi:hypothetical protein